MLQPNADPEHIQKMVLKCAELVPQDISKKIMPKLNVRGVKLDFPPCLEELILGRSARKNVHQEKHQRQDWNHAFLAQRGIFRPNQAQSTASSVRTR